AVLGRYLGSAPPGLSRRRRDLDRVLLENALGGGVTVRERTRVIGFSRDGDRGFEVAIRAMPGAAATVRTRAIVGADGRASIVARRLGLRRKDPHRRCAIIGYFRGVSAPPEPGKIVVTPSGYSGTNPPPGARSP